MIHPDDWLVILRAPNFQTTMNWVFWLVFAGPVMGFAAGSLFLPRDPQERRPRPVLWTTGLLLAMITVWGFWYGLEVRSVQARCWRAGASAVPEAWRDYCRDIPPQHVEGLYQGGVFSGR